MKHLDIKKYPEFWHFINAVSQASDGNTVDRGAAGAFADWLQERGDSRHVLVRNAVVHFPHTPFGYLDPAYIHPHLPPSLSDGINTLRSVAAEDHSSLPLYSHIDNTHSDVRLCKHTNQDETGATHDAPTLVWRLHVPRTKSFDGTPWTMSLTAPVSREQLDEHIAGLRPLNRKRWTKVADREFPKAEGPTKLARMKAPAGGMVVNKQMQSGGQFLAKAMKGIRETAQKLVRLARPEAERAALPGSVFRGSEITQPLTIRELQDVEDAHGIGRNDRLSHRVEPDHPEHGEASAFSAKKEHVAKFINALTKKRLVGHSLRSALADPSKTDSQKVAYLGAHMATEAREFLDHTQANGSPEWYGAHVDAYEQAIHNAFGFKPGSPEMTLVKAIVAATSSGTNPKTNGIAVYRMLRAGKKNNPENPILGIPAYDHDKTQEFREELAKRNSGKPVPKPGFSDRKAGQDPAAEAAWYAKYVMPHEDLADDPGYRGYTGVMVNKPGHPDHGKLVSYQNGTDEDGDPIMTKTAEGGRLYNKHRKVKVGRRNMLQRVLLPDTDPATGDLRPKGWNGKPAQVESGLNRIQSLIKDLGMAGAQDWLLSEHPVSEFQQRFDYTPDTAQIGTDSDTPIPGMFVLGPKFGAFALNLHANRPETRQHAKWLTADLWWSRTWNRMMGTMFTGKAKKGGVTAPRTPTERKAMAAAAAVATKAAGLRSVAELQAVIWYYEQSLYRMLGVKQAKSYSFLDAAGAINTRHAHDTGKNSLDDIADSWHSILRHVAGPSGWTAEQRKQAVLDILMDAAMERTPGGGKKQETAAKQLVLEWEQRANAKEAPTKLARKDSKPSVTGLQALDALAARMVASGRMPTPHMFVQAILTGQRAADHVQAAPVVKLARTDSPVEHVLYVSPSTREGSTFDQAAQGMASPDMQALTEAAKLQPTVRAVHPALGMWKDGAEESTVVHVGDPAQLHPIAEKLGRAFKQKAVLTFSGDPDGPDARHVLIVPESDPTKINEDTERHGIQFKTMVRDPKGTRVEVVDVGGALGPQIEGYAGEAGALSHTTHRGTHQFVETA